MKRVAVLFSGLGSNLRVLAEHMARDDVPAEFVLGLSNRPEAPGLEYCARIGVEAHAFDHKAYSDRAAFDAELDKQLRAAQVDLICCAGFMRLLTPAFVDSWRDRIINIHPSLLPKYKGLNTHARALAAGDKEAGCSVHYMRPEMDDGPVIVQRRVPILEGDTPETLAARVLVEEHIAYPEALDVVLKAL
jgi:phosphoribosylglycinamide formyltransferase-1